MDTSLSGWMTSRIAPSLHLLQVERGLFLLVLAATFFVAAGGTWPLRRRIQRTLPPRREVCCLACGIWHAVHNLASSSYIPAQLACWPCPPLAGKLASMLQRGGSLAIGGFGHMHHPGGGGGGSAGSDAAAAVGGPPPVVKQMNNYLGIGVDAKVSLTCCRRTVANQFSVYGCALGRASIFQQPAKGVRAQLAAVRCTHLTGCVALQLSQVALDFHQMREQLPFFFTSRELLKLHVLIRTHSCTLQCGHQPAVAPPAARAACVTALCCWRSSLPC